MCLAMTTMAQTNPLQKSAQTLAQEMVQNVTQKVSLTQEQEAQLTTLATQYFTNLRNASEDAPSTRTNLYLTFQQNMKAIMTDEVYAQWKNILQQQREQRISDNMSNK